MISAKLAASVCAASYDEAPTFKAGAVECVVQEHDRVVVVAFRGTAGARDALRDARAMPWPSKLGFVHAGFYKGIRRIWPKITPVLLDTRPTVLTGHSKGGAEATIAAGLMALAGREPRALITFGSPRTGFSKLTRVLRMVHVERYVQYGDPVPRHPWPLWGYRHPAEPIMLGQASVRLDLSAHFLASYRDALTG